MTFHDATLRTLTDDPRILAFYGEASPGDRSILYMMLETQDMAGMTSGGSPNARLWTCLAEHGWMDPVEDDGCPVTPGMETLRYRLTDRGYRAVPIMLATFSAPQAET